MEVGNNEFANLAWSEQAMKVNSDDNPSGPKIQRLEATQDSLCIGRDKHGVDQNLSDGATALQRQLHLPAL